MKLKIKCILITDMSGGDSINNHRNYHMSDRSGYKNLNPNYFDKKHYLILFNCDFSQMFKTKNIIFNSGNISHVGDTHLHINNNKGGCLFRNEEDAVNFIKYLKYSLKSKKYFPVDYFKNKCYFYNGS